MLLYPKCCNVRFEIVITFVKGEDSMLSINNPNRRKATRQCYNNWHYLRAPGPIIGLHCNTVHGEFRVSRKGHDHIINEHSTLFLQILPHLFDLVLYKKTLIKSI